MFRNPRKNLLFMPNLINNWSISFRQSFRLSKEAFLYVLEEIKPFVQSSSIPATHQLAATLRFLAEGAYQRSVGKDFHVGLARSTVCKVLKTTLEVLETKLCRKWIQMLTTEEEKRTCKVFFMEKYGIPGIIGCIDGTHVKIVRPHRDDNLYYNRKGHYSINCLVVSFKSTTEKPFLN